MKRDTLTLMDHDIRDEALEKALDITNRPIPYSSVRLSTTYWACESCNEEEGKSIPEHKIYCPACGTVRPGKEELDALKTRIRRSLSGRDKEIKKVYETRREEGTSRGPEESTDEKMAEVDNRMLEDDKEAEVDNRTLEDDKSTVIQIWKEVRAFKSSSNELRKHTLRLLASCTETLRT